MKKVVIIGGGTGGITVAAQLMNRDRNLEVVIIEPSEKHYYQPIWTVVGGGVFSKEMSERDEADYIPDGVTWIKDFVASFQPEANAVTLKGGEVVGYDYLVVSAGLQIDWNDVPGLMDALKDPNSGVASNYSYEFVDKTYKVLQNFPKGGRALFTHPNTPIKCGGAPMKIMYLAADYMNKHGLREGSAIEFYKPGAAIFGVDKYRRALDKVVARYQIDTQWQQHLVEVRHNEKIAVFENLTTNERVERTFDMLHVTPPMSAPDFLKTSPLAGAGGWVSIHKHTMQSDKFANVFACGDCTNAPTAKTGAAIRKQAPVLVENLLAVMDGTSLEASYDGYSSCPLVTGYGKLILAEFDYNSQPVESFPFDQGKERYSMYALKVYGLPEMYWNGMLRGRM